MTTMCWPHYEDDEIAAAMAVLRSGHPNYWGGQEVQAFEREFAAFCGVAHAVAVANGTLALEVALRAVGIGPGDEVVVTARSFVASASAVAMVGARPVFAEVDADSQGVDAQTIAAALTPATRAVVVVHLTGWPCEMDEIRALAEDRGLWVIEDCAQAHGARYRARPVGGLGHVAAWSFCQDKIISTGGEGGMVTTDDAAIAERAWSLKDHGRDPREVARRDHPPGFRWLIGSIGSNYRMPEMQAAIGRVQLAKLPRWHRLRTEHAAVLDERCRRWAALRVPAVPAHVDHAWYRFSVFVQPQALASGWDRDRIKAEIEAHGVQCRQGACPEIYRERAFRDFWPGDHRLPVAKRLGETDLVFQVHHRLAAAAIERAAQAIDAVMTAAQR